MNKRPFIPSASDLAKRYSELLQLRNLVEQAENRRAIRHRGHVVTKSVPHYRHRTSAAFAAPIKRNLIVNIINSKGVHIGVVRGAAVFDLSGHKLYVLKGINVYRLSGELVGHLPRGQDTEKRLDRSADRLFPVTAQSYAAR